MPNLSKEERRLASQKLIAAMRKIDADRIAAGVCRHCGGSIPCWSNFGDHAIGVRHTRQTLIIKARADLAKELRK